MKKITGLDFDIFLSFEMIFKGKTPFCDFKFCFWVIVFEILATEMYSLSASFC